MAVLHPLQLVIEEVQGLGPADAHEAVLATLSGVGQVPLAQPVQAYHGIAYPGGVVDHLPQALQHLGRMLVVLEGAGLDPAPLDHPGAKCAPVGA